MCRSWMCSQDELCIVLATSRTCRAGEAGLSIERTQCHDEETDKKKIMQLKCREFAMVKKQTGDQIANTAIMKKGGSESDESYVTRISETVCGSCAGKNCKRSDEDKDKPGPRKKCGYEPYTCGCGFKCQFMKAKDACELATHDFKKQVWKCKIADTWHQSMLYLCIFVTRGLRPWTPPL